jgi:hypothetical protein
MPIAKRVTIVLLEMLAEALLLGVLFCLLLGAWKEAPASVWLIAALPVVYVLFFHGYYFTRPLLGLVWKTGPSWQYAAIAALLFLVHMGVAIARFGQHDFTPEARRATTPFLLGGAVVVFCCALAGRFLLRKWTRSQLPRPENPRPRSEISSGHEELRTATLPASPATNRIFPV